MAFQSTLPFDAASPNDLAASLRAKPIRQGCWDELRDPSGQVRGPWRRFLELLGEDGIAGLDQTTDAIAQQVRDNDISYNVYADKGEPRPWSLDLLPFLISEAEWLTIEAGVKQRAKLLDAIVADTYGAQTLLHRGLLPPAMVFGHPGYLRPVKGFTPHGDRFLQVVAVDLARAPNGEWTVLEHRTQAPSGLGYALENRLIVSNVFAEPFRSMHVQRLAPFYSQLISTLVEGGRATMQPDEGGSPRLALLTPGPYSETFFEHSFLARYLGMTLVEGKDLTVRDDKLFLKTFSGLERVHVLLRRLDDAYCDPVELRADSTIGVPGLLQVMRAGNVMVSNVPGTGFVESPALHGFLPAISQALLDEPLALPSVQTWWCGEQAARDAALAQLDEAFVIPTWPGVELDGASLRGFSDGPQALSDWRARIEATPDAFTVQAPFPGSHAPRYADQTLSGRPAVLRAYAIVDANGHWSVMPGGFTRLGGELQAYVSMQAGSSSVDTWVLSSKPSSDLSLLPTALTPDELSHKRRIVSSRAAENLFWAGRYGERAENNVRLLRFILSALETNESEPLFDMLVGLAKQFGLLPFDTEVPARSPHAFELLLFAHLGEQAPAASIGQNLASQVRTNSDIRNRLSADHWRTILAARNDFRDAMRLLMPASASAVTGTPSTAQTPPSMAIRYDRVLLTQTLENLTTQLLAINGAQRDRMTRDEAWVLMYAGRHIERVWTMANYIREVAEKRQLHTPQGFDLLLQLFDSTLTYRSLYPGRFELPALLSLLVVEPTNPRGLYGVFGRLCKRLDEILHAADHRRDDGPAPFADASRTLASLPGLEALCAVSADGVHDTLISTCDALSDCVSAAANEISARYFSHAQPPLSGIVL
ncbi:circularly permuted type 2 ATP-grasp protein [Robbsia sp. KACC 23696]|uniref:circularly permuted type 2 ATP-grasp protein n=1 Tax=Robbsia sp. KACC 23696 TaxID=3149231 RepID=UPI00325A60B4